MPPVLKLTTAASIYTHNPFCARRTVAAGLWRQNLLTSQQRRWRWSFTTCAYPAQIRIPHRSNISASPPKTPHQGVVIGFRGGKYIYSAVRDITADMGPPRDNKEDKWFETSASPPQGHHESSSPPPPPLPPTPSAKLLTLPTILTIGRVAAVPLIICTFYVDSWWGHTATTAVFIAAAVTDWLDGYIARKMKLGSQFGAFLDPVADKLMVAATLVLLCTRPPEIGIFGQLPWLLTVPSIAIIGREITMSAVREWAASQGNKLSEAVAVNNLGKWKTATQMTALTILLAVRDSSLSGMGTLAATGAVLLNISAWLAVWSLVVYMRKIWKVLLM